MIQDATWNGKKLQPMRGTILPPHNMLWTLHRQSIIQPLHLPWGHTSYGLRWTPSWLKLYWFNTRDWDIFRVDRLKCWSQSTDKFVTDFNIHLWYGRHKLVPHCVENMISTSSFEFKSPYHGLQLTIRLRYYYKPIWCQTSQCYAMFRFRILSTFN